MLPLYRWQNIVPSAFNSESDTLIPRGLAFVAFDLVRTDFQR